jgi:ABC-type nitrate/sulfonate/bicarbonate transport system substrate-binding protein
LIGLCLGAALLVGVTSYASASKPKKLETVNLGDVAPALSTLPWYVANAEGFFKEHGIQINLVHVSSVPVGLAAGAIDVGNSSVDGAITSAAAGKSFPVLVVMTDASTQVLMIRKDEDQPAYHAKYPAGIQALPKGQSVGLAVRGSTGELFLTASMKEAGRNEGTDYSVVAGGGTTGVFAELQAHQVDLGVLAPPLDAQAVAQGVAVPLLNQGIGEGPADAQSGYGAAILANPTWVLENPTTAQNFVAAIVEAEAYIRNGILHPKQYPTAYKHVLADAVAYNTGLDPAIAATSMKLIAKITEPNFTCARAGGEIALLIKLLNQATTKPGCKTIALQSYIPKKALP